MAIALVASVSATPGSTGGATGAVDTTGATLTVVSVSSYTGGSVTSVTDSKGNTYTGLTSRSFANVAHRLFYCLAPTVGSGHTFTVNAAGLVYPAILAYAFSGVASYETEGGATGNAVASLASGSVTPSANGALILTGVCGQQVSTDTLTAGFTVATKPLVGGVNMQGSAAYYVQPTAAAINPTWSFSPSQGNVAVGTAVFLAAAVTDARVSQLVVETLSSLAAISTARTSQLVVETLSQELVIHARVSQLVAETLSPLIAAPAVTQLVAETLTPTSPSPIRVSQSPLELLEQPPTVARLSQIPLETVQQFSTPPLVYGVISQSPLEIIYPFGCYIYTPPLCPADAPIDSDAGGEACASAFPVDEDEG